MKAEKIIATYKRLRWEDAAWQGAIERVLHGFALSILVDERNYSALVTYLNNTDHP